jgi:hypothetical protein
MVKDWCESEMSKDVENRENEEKEEKMGQTQL